VSAAKLQERLLAWYAATKRDLPWRGTRDPYAIWLSETMLQQTRVDTVIPYYQRFLRELPTVLDLAAAPEDKVLSLWSGLGYYRRARMLHAAAKRVAREHGGRLPASVEGLRRLEGVGAYTAGAVASIAFGQRAAVVDGNVARVLARLYVIDHDVSTSRGSARVWSLAEELVPEGAGLAGEWNQALMDLGATVCAPRQPRCEACPVAELCGGRARGVAAELPRVAPKKAPRSVQRVAIVLASRDAVLLARRRPGGLFGGLWEPPGADGDGGELAARLGIAPQALERRGEVVHVLSHRRLEVAVLRGALGRRRRWSVPGADYDAIEAWSTSRLASGACSTLTRRILAVAGIAARS
jgi:A/G-specific adenine glycosylase